MHFCVISVQFSQTENFDERKLGATRHSISQCVICMCQYRDIILVTHDAVDPRSEKILIKAYLDNKTWFEE